MGQESNALRTLSRSEAARWRVPATGLLLWGNFLGKEDGSPERGMGVGAMTTQSNTE